MQQDIVELGLDSTRRSRVIWHTLEQLLSRLLRRVHPKNQVKIVSSNLVFPSVKILLNEYSCLCFRPGRIGEKMNFNEIRGMRSSATQARKNVNLDDVQVSIIKIVVFLFFVADMVVLIVFFGKQFWQILQAILT